MGAQKSDPFCHMDRILTRFRVAIVCANTDARMQLAYFKYHFAIRVYTQLVADGGDLSPAAQSVDRSPVFRRGVWTSATARAAFSGSTGNSFTGRRGKKAVRISTYRRSRIVSQSAATCDPRAVNEWPCFRAIGNPPAPEMEYRRNISFFTCECPMKNATHESSIILLLRNDLFFKHYRNVELAESEISNYFIILRL